MLTVARAVASLFFVRATVQPQNSALQIGNGFTALEAYIKSLYTSAVELLYETAQQLEGSTKW